MKREYGFIAVGPHQVRRELYLGLDQERRQELVHSISGYDLGQLYSDLDQEQRRQLYSGLDDEARRQLYSGLDDEARSTAL